MLRSMWQAVAAPVLNKFVRRFFAAVVGPLDVIEGTTSTVLARTWDMDAELRNHVAGINERLVRIEERVAEMEQRSMKVEVLTREAVAQRWDELATTRRLTSLETKLAHSPLNSGYADAEADGS